MRFTERSGAVLDVWRLNPSIHRERPSKARCVATTQGSSCENQIERASDVFRSFAAHALRSDELLQRFHQSRPGDLKLLQSFIHGASEDVLAFPGKRHQDIGALTLPANEAIDLPTVNQFHNTVMAQTQLMSENPDRRRSVGAESADGQKQLVLPGFNPCVPGSAIAEFQIPSDVITKLGQSLVVGVGNRFPSQCLHKTWRFHSRF